MASLSPADVRTIEPATHADGLDLRDHRDVAPGYAVIDLSSRMRPSGSRRRSNRHTHTRLVAALARINAEVVASTPTDV